MPWPCQEVNARVLRVKKKEENIHSQNCYYHGGKQPIKRSDVQTQQSPRKQKKNRVDKLCCYSEFISLPAFLAVIRDDVNICNARDLKPAMRLTREIIQHLILLRCIYFLIILRVLQGCTHISVVVLDFCWIKKNKIIILFYKRFLIRKNRW